MKIPLVVSTVLFFVTSSAVGSGLPKREGPLPKTTSSVPHKQLEIEVDPQLYAELVRRTFSIPGIEKGESFTPYPDALGIWLSRKIRAARPKAFLSGREYSHFHPDGSLHAPLPPVRAREAVKAGWATHHPWANRRDGWEGLVLIYTPQTEKQLEVVFQLIVDSFNYVAGKKIKATDYIK